MARQARFLVTALIACLLALTGCSRILGQYDQEARHPAEPIISGSPSPEPRPIPCDPGFGFPKPSNGCPDPEPESGWLTAGPKGDLQLDPFRTFVNDARGRAYARHHGIDFPYSNDYYDAATGPGHALELAAGTVCTGAILVGYREPLLDHVVSCEALVEVAGERGVPVAVWRDAADVVQVSELYRP